MEEIVNKIDNLDDKKGLDPDGVLKRLLKLRKETLIYALQTKR